MINQHPSFYNLIGGNVAIAQPCLTSTLILLLLIISLLFFKLLSHKTGEKIGCLQKSSAVLKEKSNLLPPPVILCHLMKTDNVICGWPLTTIGWSECNLLVSIDDCSGVNLLFDELVSSAQQFRCNDDNTGGTVPNLLVLELRQLAQHLSGRGLHFQQLEDSRSVICHGHIANLEALC